MDMGVSLGASLKALSLEEQVGVVDAVTQFQRLRALDQIWTGYLASARPPLPDADVQALESLVARMRDLLNQARDRADYLGHIVDGHEEALAAGYEQILADGPLDESGKALLRDTVERHGGSTIIKKSGTGARHFTLGGIPIVNYVRSGTYTIMNTAGSEVEVLTTKIDRIRNGDFVAGDLTRDFLCGMAASSIGAGILALATPPPTSGIAIAFGMGILVYQQMTGQGC